MSSAAPGWYPVEGDDRLRWWDGQAWTLHFQDKPGPSASAVGTAVPDATSHLSVTGAFPDDAIWTATGKSVTGAGAGRYWLTARDMFFERGGQGTGAQQVPVAGVSDVDVKQTMTQKARGVFTVQVQVNRGSGVEVLTMDDIPEGRMAGAIIKATAQQARLAPQSQPDGTNGLGGVPAQATAQPGQVTGQAPQAKPEPWMPAQMQAQAQQTAQQSAQQTAQQSAGPDPMELLRKLGELRDAGILTDEEFATKKAQVLSRL